MLKTGKFYIKSTHSTTREVIECAPGPDNNVMRKIKNLLAEIEQFVDRVFVKYTLENLHEPEVACLNGKVMYVSNSTSR